MKKKISKFVLMFCLALVLTACSKAEMDTGDSKSYPTEKVTEPVTDTPKEDPAKEYESEPTATSISEPTATDTPTATPEPTATPTATPIPEPTKVSMGSADTGDIILFGSYEQDNNFSNGKEPIEWIVLSNDGEKILVLSKYALDCKPYNTNYKEITWENCTLRNWLNDEFYNSAFTSTEMAIIIKSCIENNDNSEYGTDGGNDTYDNVFLLSMYDMINTGFGFSGDFNEYDVARRCAATEYAKAQGAFLTEQYYDYYEGKSKPCATADGEPTCWWWLRSPGYSAYYAVNVYAGGSISMDVHIVNIDNLAVRPALYISLKS